MATRCPAPPDLGHGTRRGGTVRAAGAGGGAGGRIGFRFRHRVDGLARTGPAVDGVHGVVLEPSEAERGASTSRVPVGEFTLRAPAVIVASSGIGGNHALVRKKWPKRLGEAPAHMVSGVPAHVDGRMLAIGEASGGDVPGRVPVFGPAGRARRGGAGMMRRRVGLLLLGGCLVAAAPPGVHYVNTRFGFSADIPEGFVADDPPENNDGQAYHSASGHAILSVSAIGNAAEQSLAEVMADNKAECLHDPAEYFVLRPGWAVLSCYTKEGILYTKVIMQGRGMDAVFTTARMTYPAAERARWDAVAAAVAEGLRPAPAD